MVKRLYSIWHNMKSRCYYKENTNYKYYGEKGIKVCDEWKDNFQSFAMWALQNGYSDELSIDRIDGNKDYYPENCRWVDNIQQNNNTSKNRFHTYNGQTKTVSQWARQYGIDRNLLNTRLKRGWDFEKAIVK